MPKTSGTAVAVTFVGVPGRSQEPAAYPMKAAKTVPEASKIGASFRLIFASAPRLETIDGNTGESPSPIAHVAGCRAVHRAPHRGFCLLRCDAGRAATPLADLLKFR